MAIVCGTDFSEPSARAVQAAAHLSARLKQTLHLVHTLDALRDDDADSAALRGWALERLTNIAHSLEELAGPIQVHVEVGQPDDVLLEMASRVEAKLIVIGPVGHRYGETTLGGHADSLAQRSHVPVLVVRESGPFEQWGRDSKPLCVVLGVDSSTSSETALGWIDDLRRVGPCEVVAIYLYWPPEQFQRLGLGGVRSYIAPDPVVTRTLEREFYERMSQLRGDGPVRYRSEPHLGRVADRLADLASEEHADLVVVGSRGLDALTRFWEGSVSRGLLQCARSSVVCVPAPVSPQRRPTPQIRSVLAATDFSPLGDAAVPMAYAAVGPGGTVHLVHVVKAPPPSLAPHDIFSAEQAAEQAVGEHEVVARRLLGLVPDDVTARAKNTEIHVLESDDPAKAICQAAERLGVDLLCLGTHGHSGVAQVLLGSVAQGVLAHSTRPVLITRAKLD